MSEVIFDKRDKMQRVEEMLVPGEQLFMVLDCKGRGSCFLGVTDERLIIRDDGFARFKKAIISVPYGRIYAVGVDQSAGWVKGSSRITFSAGDDDWDLNFKGDKARQAYAVVMENLLQ